MRSFNSWFSRLASGTVAESPIVDILLVELIELIAREKRRRSKRCTALCCSFSFSSILFQIRLWLASLIVRGSSREFVWTKSKEKLNNQTTILRITRFRFQFSWFFSLIYLNNFNQMKRVREREREGESQSICHRKALDNSLFFIN